MNLLHLLVKGQSNIGDMGNNLEQDNKNIFVSDINLKK
jgi:hypothetical protein